MAGEVDGAIVALADLLATVMATSALAEPWKRDAITTTLSHMADEYSAKGNVKGEALMVYISRRVEESFGDIDRPHKGG
jgi:hypothetical protein